jgi:hypothetical protein
MYCSAAAAGAERCAHSAERGPLASLHAEGRRCRTPKPRVGLPFLPHLLSPNTARTSRALVEGTFALPSEALGGGIRLIATGQRLWTNVGSALRLLVRCRPFFDLVRLRIALLGHWIIGPTSQIPIIAHGWFLSLAWTSRIQTGATQQSGGCFTRDRARSGYGLQSNVAGGPRPGP